MTLKKISPEKLSEKMNYEKNILLLDVRAEDKYNEYHITNSNIEMLNIPKNHIFELEKGKEDKVIPLQKRGKQLVITCTTGNSAIKCGEILSNQGYDVTILTGGITAWRAFKGRDK